MLPTDQFNNAIYAYEYICNMLFLAKMIKKNKLLKCIFFMVKCHSSVKPKMTAILNLDDYS